MVAASRRWVLVLGAAGLTGCQVYGRPQEAAPPPSPPSPSPPPASPVDGATPESPPAGSPSAAGPDRPGTAVGTPLVGTGDVTVGGGVILADQNLVVTQPAEGEFRAFSATCTHQGCTVSDVADGTINCNCHRSRFAITDGSVVSGPAGSPLPETEIVVDGGTVGLP